MTRTLKTDLKLSPHDAKYLQKTRVAAQQLYNSAMAYHVKSFANYYHNGHFSHRHKLLVEKNNALKQEIAKCEDCKKKNKGNCVDHVDKKKSINNEFTKLEESYGYYRNAYHFVSYWNKQRSSKLGELTGLFLNAHVRNKILEDTITSFETTKWKNKICGKIAWKNRQRPLTLIAGNDSDAGIKLKITKSGKYYIEYVFPKGSNLDNLRIELDLSKYNCRKPFYGITILKQYAEDCTNNLRPPQRIISSIRIHWKKCNKGLRPEAILIHKGKGVLVPIGTGKVMIDKGPRFITISAPTSNMVVDMKQSSYTHEIRKIDSRIGRKMKWNNPENINVNDSGNSAGYKFQSQKTLELRKNRRITDRKMATTRKRNQQKLANKLLLLGDDFTSEKDTIKGWQSEYGKAISYSAPSQMELILKEKIDTAKGLFTSIPTKLACTRTCCRCGHKNKPTRDRIIICESCGLTVDRNINSCYNQGAVEEEKHINTDRSKQLLLDRGQEYIEKHITDI